MSDLLKIVKDFRDDIVRSFPEYGDKLDQRLIDLSENEIVGFCKKIYPPNFFNILYQNVDLFNDSIELLPGIDFNLIWTEDISEKTRGIIWKYLQLILFTVVQGEEDNKLFGETQKLFEAIDEDAFRKKIEESLGEISEMFESSGGMIPDSDDLHGHINGLLGGNLGKLAKEIAEETANEMNIDMENASTVGDVFQKLFKSPGKLMKLVKKVGEKLDNRLKSGELKESELMQEAADLMGKMQSMPGMKNFQKMFSGLGMPTGGKMNMGAMQNMMNMNIRKAKRMERMREKLNRKKAEKTTNEPNIKEEIKKTPRRKKKRRRKRKKKK